MACVARVALVLHVMHNDCMDAVYALDSDFEQFCRFLGLLVSGVLSM